MKGQLLSLVAVVGMVFLSGSLAEATTYYNVDTAVGGPMGFSGASSSYNAGLWTINLTATNSSADTLLDVHWIQQFVWDQSVSPWPAFDWDDINKIWDNGPLTWTTYGVMGQSLLISMSDTNTPLSWTVPGRDTAYVGATDSLPAFSLGDFAPFESKTFTLYGQVPSQYTAQVGGFFVAVPEPGTVASLAMAAAIGLFLANRRRRDR